MCYLIFTASYMNIISHFSVVCDVFVLTVTWKNSVRCRYRGHDDTVGPLGGVQQVTVGVVELVHYVVTRRQTHCHREAKQACLIVMDTIPVGCKH